jgi:hypothetical protein
MFRKLVGNTKLRSANFYSVFITTCCIAIGVDSIEKLSLRCFSVRLIHKIVKSMFH